LSRKVVDGKRKAKPTINS